MKAITALQKLVLDPQSNITDILRSALLISHKLSLLDFKTWCELELKGYDDIDDSNVPEYRHLYGSFHVTDVNTKVHQPLGDRAACQVIKDSIIFFQESLDNNDQFLSIRFPDDKNKNLKQMFGISSKSCIFYSSISRTYFLKALDIIRTKILEFSIELENKGILGDEWEFTEQEKQMTQNINYNISNVGNIANHNQESTINQIATINVNVIKGDFSSLASKLRSHGIEEKDIQELQTIIDVTPLPQSPSEYSVDLKSWMSKMVTKSIDGTWQIAVGAAGSLLATGIQQYFGILS
ncbi:hypothetical protein QE380_000390 [Acinetobacter baylyi]|uniref:AbiTii domain-containing protein n=1 Tax=Acinetobacter baylyi TaxID=202950 RepID=A0ABU0USE8_ACIBI|nr:hypothetical protein [Acinetobacter baylyi]MDQ1207467.1 hypothetical protein [Acinetobacter baylyi]MDR6105453.1 hypothetical protein [Acinetobacter baylyi]MDR6184337.1 hypothetical protein [Acinetobacter baylyi]